MPFPPQRPPDLNRLSPSPQQSPRSSGTQLPSGPGTPRYSSPHAWLNQPDSNARELMPLPSYSTPALLRSAAIRAPTAGRNQKTSGEIRTHSLDRLEEVDVSMARDRGTATLYVCVAGRRSHGDLIRWCCPYTLLQKERCTIASACSRSVHMAGLGNPMYRLPTPKLLRHLFATGARFTALSASSSHAFTDAPNKRHFLSPCCVGTALSTSHPKHKGRVTSKSVITEKGPQTVHRSPPWAS